MKKRMLTALNLNETQKESSVDLAKLSQIQKTIQTDHGKKLQMPNITSYLNAATTSSVLSPNGVHPEYSAFPFKSMQGGSAANLKPMSVQFHHRNVTKKYSVALDSQKQQNNSPNFHYFTGEKNLRL